jgi:putative tryptophan/tyrosine transport system substrate-binding protein
LNKRDTVLALLALGAAPLARAQQAKVPQLGVLVVGNPEPFFGQFVDGLRDRGYIIRKNIVLELRSAEGKMNLLSGLAAELVRLKVDVIVANQTPAAKAAKQATNEIPIVMAPAGDPVGTGLIVSLARPGGNVTGVSAATAEIAGKSLEIIREVLPSARRVAVLANTPDAFSKPFLEQIQIAARALEIEIQIIMVGTEDQLKAAFLQIDGKRTDAVILQPSLPRKRAADLALKRQIALVCPAGGFAEMGGLMSYAGKPSEMHHQAAVYVDKILKGAKPVDLPVEQPTKFELVINLKTAKAIGFTIPKSVLARADEVIQ